MLELGLLTCTAAAVLWWFVNHDSVISPPARRRAENVIHKIKIIGNESGPARQLAYLRKLDVDLLRDIVCASLLQNAIPVRRRRYPAKTKFDGEFELEGEWYAFRFGRYEPEVSREELADFFVLCHTRSQRGFFLHLGRTGEGVSALGGDIVRILSGASLLQCLGVIAAPCRERSPWHSVVHRRWG